MIGQAQELGLSYLGSATLAENFDGLLPESFRKLLLKQKDRTQKELVRDLLTNQSFRRDVYVNGMDPLWSREARLHLDGLRLSRVVELENLDEDSAFQFPIGFGGVKGNREWFTSLMHVFADQPVSLGELRASSPSTPLPELLQNLMLLITKGSLVVVPPPRDPQPAHRLNALIADRVAVGAPYRSLACPLSGNHLTISDTDLLLFHALLRGHSQADLPRALDASLMALEWKPMLEDKPLDGQAREDAVAQMTELFCQRLLPRLRRLGVLS